MSNRLKPTPMPAEVVGAVATEQAAAGDGAHLVVQLRPADPAAVVAEPDELDRVRVRGAPWRRCAESIDGVPSLQSGRDRTHPIAGRWQYEARQPVGR